MNRSKLIRTLAVASSAMVVTALGGAAVAMSPEDTATVVVNKLGHEVNEHAAKGQARAAEARARHADDVADQESDQESDDDAGGVTGGTGTHGQAGQDHGQAGDDHGQAGQEHGQAADDHGRPEGHGDEARGQDGDDHGRAGQEHGNPGGDAAPGAND